MLRLYQSGARQLTDKATLTEFVEGLATSSLSGPDFFNSYFVLSRCDVLPESELTDALTRNYDRLDSEVQRLMLLDQVEKVNATLTGRGISFFASVLTSEASLLPRIHAARSAMWLLGNRAQGELHQPLAALASPDTLLTIDRGLLLSRPTSARALAEFVGSYYAMHGSPEDIPLLRKICQHYASADAKDQVRIVMERETCRAIDAINLKKRR
jgi:hypothetical protein